MATDNFAENLLRQIQQLQWDVVGLGATWAKVLYDFSPEQHDELAVSEDQYVQLMMEPQMDWTFCRALDQDSGKMGYVPTQYFEILDSKNLPHDLSVQIAELQQKNGNLSLADIELEYDEDDDDEYAESTTSNTFTSMTTTASVFQGESHYDSDDDESSTYVDSIAILGSDDEDGFDTDNDMPSSAEEFSPRPSLREIQTKVKEEEEAMKNERRKAAEREQRREARKTLGLNTHFRQLTTTLELHELHQQTDEHHHGMERKGERSDENRNEPGHPPITQRQAVINEIVSTEQYYVNCLTVFDRDYIAPMRLLNARKETRILESQDFDLCFKPIAVIKMVNTELLSCLENIQRGNTIDPESKFPVQTIGQLFIKMSPLLKMYHVYVNSYDNISKRVKYLTAHSERFSTFVSNTNKRVRRENKLTLWDLMISPVQRLPRYNLLLRELMKQTDESSEEWEDLSKAISLMEGITAHINDNIRETENVKRMAQLNKAINWRSFSEPLIQSHRKLITEGTLKRVIRSDRTGMRSSRRNVFLFNDLLLICNKDNYNHHIKFTETPLPWVMDKPNTRCFEVVTSTKNIMLKAHTTEEKEIWMKDITGCIQKLIDSHPELRCAPRAQYEKRSSSLGGSNNSLKGMSATKKLRSPRKKDNRNTRGEDIVSDSESTTSTISPLSSPLTSPRQHIMVNGVRLPIIPRNATLSDSSASSPSNSPFSSPRAEVTTTFNGPAPSSKAAKILGLSTEGDTTFRHNRRARTTSLPPIRPPLPSYKPIRSGTLTQSQSTPHKGSQFAVDQSELNKILERRRLASESEDARR